MDKMDGMDGMDARAWTAVLLRGVVESGERACAAVGQRLDTLAEGHLVPVRLSGAELRLIRAELGRLEGMAHHGGTEGTEKGEEDLTQSGQSREGAERAGEWEDTSGCGSPGEAE